jgi:hypothetical protein
MFLGVSNRFLTPWKSVQNGPFRYCTKDGAKQVEVASQFSQRTHPNHSIWPKTHVFGRFEPFRYCTKVGAKWAEQVPLPHKFAKRNCAGFFSQRRHPIHYIRPKTHILRVFWTVSLLHETRCEMGWTGAITTQIRKQSWVGIFCNERTRSTPFDAKLMF